MLLSYGSMQDPLKNEANLPIWLPFLFAFLGALGCIYTAYILIPEISPSALTSNKATELSTAQKENDNMLPATDDSEQTIITQSTPAIENSTAELFYDCPPLFIISFEENSLEPLLSGQPKKISQLKDWLSLNPNESIILGGHSSSEGLREPNLILSYRRAKAASRFLRDLGISINQISTQAFGEEKPIAGIPSLSAKNRRVTMQVKGMDVCQNHSDDY